MLAMLVSYTVLLLGILIGIAATLLYQALSNLPEDTDQLLARRARLYEIRQEMDHPLPVYRRRA